MEEKFAYGFHVSNYKEVKEGIYKLEPLITNEDFVNVFEYPSLSSVTGIDAV